MAWRASPAQDEVVMTLDVSVRSDRASRSELRGRPIVCHHLAEIFATGIFAAASSGARRRAACDLASRGLPGAYTDACGMVVHGLALFEGLYASVTGKE